MRTVCFKRFASIRPALLALALLLAATACAKRIVSEPLPATKTIAVAGFQNPQESWELLAGCLPDQCQLIERKILIELDAILGEELEKSKRAYVGPSDVRRCREVELAKLGEKERTSAFSFWLDVGQCAGTDYLLLPQVMLYHERQGGEWGAKSPASVAMDFYLIDVKERGIVGRYRFDETQRPLTDNMMDIGTFFKRGAHWVTAQELSREAVAGAVKELGL